MTTPHARRRFWRRCRVYFRRFRIAVWLLILALVSALVYLNQVGLPDFVKKPLLEKLRARGVDLQFSRLRLRWFEGIVAENVKFGRADEPFSPHLTVAEARVELDPHALAQLQVQVRALILRQGRLLWPLVDNEQAPRQLVAEKIQTDLRFLPGDEWSLDNFRAQFAGATIRLSGVITNASSVRQWRSFRSGAPSEPAGVWQNRLRALADNLERIRFSTPPELLLNIEGDARDLRSFNVQLMLNAPGAETPWGSFSEGRFIGRLLPADTNDLSRAELNLEAANAQTQWGTTTNLSLSITARAARSEPNLIQAEMRLATEQSDTPWGSLSNAQLTVHWQHSLTNPVPVNGEADLVCSDVKTERWGSARQLHFTARLAQPPEYRAPSATDNSWGPWAKLRPYWLHWEGKAVGFQWAQVSLAELACAGTWQPPELVVTNLYASFAPGKVDARMHLNVVSREMNLNLASDVDLNRLLPLLPEGARRWLADASWKAPPRMNGDVSLVLPAWDKPLLDWRSMLPSVRLKGEFELEQGGSYRGISVASAHSHLSYSNACWYLPDFSANRPEGRLAAEFRADERTKEFYGRVDSSVDLRMLLPVLDSQQRKVFDIFTLTAPPKFDAELRGRLNNLESLQARGLVELTNFTFRGESFSGLQTSVEYSNRWVRFMAPRIQRGTQQMHADAIVADFNADEVYITNGFSTAEPMVIARAIGPQVAKAIEPYRFSKPPVGHVYGTVPMHGEEKADLHFDLAGGPFHWWKFNLPDISGHIHWRGQRVDLTDIRADFYGGTAAGFARFHFLPDNAGANYTFGVMTTNVLLHPLVADLSGTTNSLEGRVTGDLVITSANYAQSTNVNGYGNMELHDGLLWDLKLFGIFSRMLEGIAPGLAKSRATAGRCSFNITNAVIYTDNLEIQATPVRLAYRGTVDLDGKVNARVEAELLKDMWVVGPVLTQFLSPLSKIFAYRVTGTLSQPKAEPLFFVPNLVLFPFHPLRSLKDLFPENSAYRTNSPNLSPPRRSGP